MNIMVLFAHTQKLIVQRNEEVSQFWEGEKTTSNTLNKFERQNCMDIVLIGMLISFITIVLLEVR